jgi:hypothetical protein
MALVKTGSGSDLLATVTPLTLAKTTNITGFNDIAATAIVSSGAITTSGGAVSTVTNTTQLNGAATVVLTDASSDAVIADAVWNAATVTYGAAGSYGLLIETDLDATISSRLAPAGTLATVTNLTNAPTSGDLTTTMKTSVQTAAEAGLVTHRLDELLNADSDIDGAAPPTVGSVFHELLTKTAGSFTYDQTTDSLEALRDRGDAAWITATGFSTHSAADVWSVAARQLTGTQTFNVTGNITGNLSGSVGSVTGLTASDVGAIKLQTDKMVFTVANQIDANIQYVNDVAVTGNGQVGTEWGP